MSRAVVIISLAAGFLLRHRRRVAVTVLGAGTAVAVALVALAIADGYRSTLIAPILARGAHLTVNAGDVRGRRSDLLIDVGTATGAVELGRMAERADRIRLRNVMTVVRSIERTLGGQLEAASPYLAAQVLATYGSNERVLAIRGIMPEREDRLSGLSRAIRSGSLERLAATRHGMLLGRRAARELGAGAGDQVRVVSMTGDIFNVEVVGVYDLDIESANNIGIVNLRLAQTIERALPSEASAIALRLPNAGDAEAVRQRLERAIGREVQTWEHTNADVLATEMSVRNILAGIAGAMVIIAALLVAHAVSSSADEDRRDRAILASIGLGARGQAMLLIAQGALLVLAGSLLGVLLAPGFVSVIRAIPLEKIAHMMPLERSTLPAQFDGRSIALVITAFIAGGTIASLVPALVRGRTGAGALFEAEDLRTR